MDDTIIMDSVIQKYFAGETSEQEEKYLLAWLEESEEHRKYFFELKSLWGARRVFEESTDLSRFASFMRSTDHRIGSIVAGERSTRRRRLVRWTLGAAAAVLLAVCAGTAWHFLSTPDIYRVYENTGDAVTTVTLDDGTQFDSSYDRGEPLEFTCGAGQMIKGFDAAVVDMQVGEKKTVHIPAADAYGEHNPEMVLTFPAEQVPNIEQIEKGMKLFLSTPSGMPVPAVVIDVTPEVVTLDANHELAGKDLNFDIELVEVED